MPFSGQDQVKGDDHRLRKLQEAATAAVVATCVSPMEDIKRERHAASFSSQELCCLVNGGQAKLDRKTELLSLVKSLPGGEKKTRPNLSREEEYVQALQGAFSIWEQVRAGRLSQEDGLIMRSLLDMPSGLELHIGMWMPTIQALATPEQQEKWLKPSMRFQLIGTYAQTELGHGSFLRGLETTATYDKETQSFIIHSPTITSSKWWPGGLGKSSTHAVVMARLFLGGKDYGPHPFVVQLRSLSDHQPMPGVTVGDMGQKLGYNGVDNGFLRFDHVRVGRECLLSKFSGVSPAGEYLPPAKGNEKSSYATLVFVRATLVRDAGIALSKAVTVATRYNAVRRQSGATNERAEFQVLDYGNQYSTLLPLIATSYSLHFMGQSMLKLYYKFDKDREANDFSLLPELHQLTAGLKAISTWDAATGIEKCRFSCGGNGFLQASGLPRMLTYYLQNVTWDGENSVMALQTARHLLKCFSGYENGRPILGSANYIGRYLDNPMVSCTASQESDFSDLRVLLSIMEHRAASLVATASGLLRAAENDMGDKDQAWNSCAAELVRAARAHCEAVMAANFAAFLETSVANSAASQASLTVLTRLAALQSLNLIHLNIGDLLADGFLGQAQAQAVHLQWRKHLQLLRPEAVALVDAFGLSDYELHDSAIGRSDGDVYRALLDSTAASPLNRTEEGPAYVPVLKARLTRQLSKL